ncbi:translation initiation factor IF-2-like [Sphaerodactylus townsendi]|uniref:translation initiation factor IF-2-like n=1 Tax=Sphaerodactylus townsendi TaxID=933632 RepID=UPI0020275D7E|nr:translation initiation factor IF-2-like [Sphaerodactylus townsendi]
MGAGPVGASLRGPGGPRGLASAAPPSPVAKAGRERVGPAAAPPSLPPEAGSPREARSVPGPRHPRTGERRAPHLAEDRSGPRQDDAEEGDRSAAGSGYSHGGGHRRTSEIQVTRQVEQHPSNTSPRGAHPTDRIPT